MKSMNMARRLSDEERISKLHKNNSKAYSQIEEEDMGNAIARIVKDEVNISYGKARENGHYEVLLRGKGLYKNHQPMIMCVMANGEEAIAEVFSLKPRYEDEVKIAIYAETEEEAKRMVYFLGDGNENTVWDGAGLTERLEALSEGKVDLDSAMKSKKPKIVLKKRF